MKNIQTALIFNLRLCTNFCHTTWPRRFVAVLLRPTASAAAQPSLASHERRRGLPGVVRAAARDEAAGAGEEVTEKLEQ